MNHARSDSRAVGKVMGDTIKSMSKIVGKVLCASCLLVGRAVCQGCKKIENTFKTIGEMVAEACRKVNNGSFAGTIVGFMGDLFEGCSEVFGRAIGVIGSTLGHTIGGIGQFLDFTCGGLGNILGDFFQGAGEVMSMALFGLAVMTRNVVEFILDGAVSALTEFVRELAKSCCAICGSNTCNFPIHG